MSNDTASTQNPFSSYGGTLQPYSRSLFGPLLVPFTVSPNQATYILGNPTAAGNNVVAFPATAACSGMIFTFILDAIVGAGKAWVITATTNTIIGLVNEPGANPTAKAAGNTLTFAATSGIGTQATFTCDGTNWYVIASGTVAATVS